MLLELGEEPVARLLCVAQQHGRVLVEEDGVVDSRVADAEGALHHNHLRRWPNKMRQSELLA